MSEKTKAPNFYEMAAKRALGADCPEGWEAYGYDARGGPDAPLKVTGMVPYGYERVGGAPIWKGKGKTVKITREEVATVRRQWEAETGCCGKCGGDGQELAGWGVESGARYRPCSECDATGKPPQLATDLATSDPFDPPKEGAA